MDLIYDLIEELACSQEERPHTHLAPRKIVKQTESIGHRQGEWRKKETLNSSSAWKHQRWMKELDTEEKPPALALLERDLKITSI